MLGRLLLTSLLLAILLAAQRTVQIAHGGPDTTDHLQTLTVAVLAAADLGLLLWRSRHRDPTTAAAGLLALYYCLGAWSSFSEGPAKSFTILFWVLLVIAAAILGGARTAAAGTGLTAATLTAATIVLANHLIGASAETRAEIPDAGSLIAIIGALGRIALLLSILTRERPQPANQLPGHQPLPTTTPSTSALTARELQVTKLIAAGHSNAEISSQLRVSPRTVETHVANALRKTNSSNRTALAILAINEGLAEHGK